MIGDLGLILLLVLLNGVFVAAEIAFVSVRRTRLDELVTSGTAPAPGAQIDLPPTAIYDPGNFTISFLPQDGAAITELKQGKHTGKVKFWPIKNPDQIRFYSWTFYTD